ncbi:uncharacterized protein LOC123514534 [Portunus trituberculatus]|uniref:uncharacterized protein LOC123514534 n=1 Tax=Portunus trituberculatus TaxID=210409 RepID=UPI001E1CEA83|nr:uncharacterized protein LOC123514534 [Portunus trituberculatus]XP_045128386.1 uncharacterized protein LOC123514534 [Portunus trituberculatus]XP_045128387.1 uncharacterized protein LOC123514534 [Portunus trituberculatus]XP_045128389.1 uncharacterized protein LOC123514534 [Portunus trituberculatus]
MSWAPRHCWPRPEDSFVLSCWTRRRLSRLLPPRSRRGGGGGDGGDRRHHAGQGYQAAVQQEYYPVRWSRLAAYSWRGLDKLIRKGVREGSNLLPSGVRAPFRRPRDPFTPLGAGGLWDRRQAALHPA